ncbi:YhfG family protein [Entomohabitans teleogrylli]|uniref:YhfG family protein n=1 Tax=Entomohabitans teleogrylli TaxID=1384589 RepID=UPI0008FC81EE|nr:YhfG family protein [Entomohabitans teleogrylli]
MNALTDRQKQHFWESCRSRNYQASQRLEGIDAPPIALSGEQAVARIAELRRHYER